MMIKFYLIFLLSVFIASCCQILLKISANKKHKSFKTEYINPYVIVSYIILVMSTLLSTYAYKRVSFKVAPIIESSSYIFIIALSSLVFKEKITFKKILGISFILLGVFVFVVF